MIPVFLWNNIPVGIQGLICISLVLAWTVFLAVELKIIFAMKKKVKQNPEYLIILGAQVRGERITNSLKRRLDKAFDVWRQSPDCFLVVSGGKGRGEDISEAEAMKRYLLSKDVPSVRIIEEDKSTSTKENLLFSKALINCEDKAIGIVTNNFHVYRATILAEKCGLKKVCGISAGTNPILFLNYIVREFFAILWMFIPKQMRNV